MYDQLEGIRMDSHVKMTLKGYSFQHLHFSTIAKKVTEELEKIYETKLEN
jgi:hypothetical protein